MRILLMGQHYAPEEVSGAVLATELATDLAGRGHVVTFVTCAPNYPAGRLFPGYQNRFFSIQILDGVRVVRVWSYLSSQKTFWRRIFNYGTFSFSAFYGGFFAGKPDVILSASPPLPLSLSACFLSKIWRIPWVLRVEDLYPEAAVVAGVLRNPVAIRFFSALEVFLYNQATLVSLISEGFRQNLLSKGVPLEKLSVLPVWADPDIVRPLPKSNKFRSAHGLDEKFVILYSGNIGLTSALDDVIAAAELLQVFQDIHFVIVGEGVKKSTLIDRARRGGLSNITFLPYQPLQDYPEMLAAADLGLVTLNVESSYTSLPVKTFNVMASGRPVMALASADGELGRVVREARCGIVIPPGDPHLLVRTLLDLKTQPELLNEMGLKGRSRLENYYSRKYCVDLYECTLRQALQHGDITCPA